MGTAVVTEIATWNNPIHGNYKTGSTKGFVAIQGENLWIYNFLILYHLKVKNIFDSF